MEINKLTIVCGGHDISFGMNLLRLFRYKDENNLFFSSKYRLSSVDMYTLEVYKRTGGKKKTFSVFINQDKEILPSMKLVFDKYGMKIRSDDARAVLLADVKEISSTSQYRDFLKLANARREEYLKTEEKYIGKTDAFSKNWIVPVFESIEPKCIFGSKHIKQKLQQQYDCLAFEFYLNHFTAQGEII